MNPHHLCPVCGSDDLAVDHDVRKVTCRACRHVRTLPDEDGQQFLALNERITTLQDVLLEHQETMTLIQHRLDHLNKVMRAIIRKLEPPMKGAG